MSRSCSWQSCCGAIRLTQFPVFLTVRASSLTRIFFSSLLDSDWLQSGMQTDSSLWRYEKEVFQVCIYGQVKHSWILHNKMQLSDNCIYFSILRSSIIYIKYFWRQFNVRKRIQKTHRQNFPVDKKYTLYSTLSNQCFWCILTAGTHRCVLCGVNVDGPTYVCECCTQGKHYTVQVSHWTLSCNDRISQGR